MSVRQGLVFVFLLTIATRSSLQQDVVDEPPIVETPLGKIQGTIMTSQYGANIYAYRGMRYAKEPSGARRFAPPEPVEPWEGVLNAKSNSLICPQAGITLLMTENCLSINVYTRDVNATRPVIVYIHGGANVLGSGHSLYEAGPDYLLDQDVVLVAFNYRLGALGFLSTRTPDAPGNYGYLDQVLALKWVQSNIASFGGDPDLVTIFGVSAGSMAVTLHMASPLSAGLFHRAVAMSGSATNRFSIDNLGWTRKLAREVSCPMYNPRDVVDCLRQTKWSSIVDACSKWEPYKFVNMKWNYEVDGHFLPAHPSEMFLTGKFNKVPLLVGFTKNELDFTLDDHASNPNLLNDISVNFDLYAPEMFLYNASVDASIKNESQKTSAYIKRFYMGSDNATVTSENLRNLGEAFSDAIIGHGVHRLVELVRREQPVYYYRMDYVGERSLYPDGNGRPQGFGHADDLQYIMPSSWYGSKIPIDHPDMFMVDRMTKMLATFAKSGVPEFDDGFAWEPSRHNKSIALYNNRSCSMNAAPYEERFALWDDLFPLGVSAAGHLHFTTSLFIMLGLLVALSHFSW